MVLGPFMAPRGGAPAARWGSEQSACLPSEAASFPPRSGAVLATHEESLNGLRSDAPPIPP